MKNFLKSRGNAVQLSLIHIYYYRVALNGPPREEGSLFSAHREPQPDSGWLD